MCAYLKRTKVQANALTYAILFFMVILLIFAVKTFLIQYIRWGEEGGNPRRNLREKARLEQFASDKSDRDESEQANMLLAGSPTFGTKSNRKARGTVVPEITRALDILKNTSSGGHVNSLIRIKYIEVRAVDAMPDDVKLNGWSVAWVKEDNAIYLEKDILQGAPAEFVAALIAHAAAYADYDFNPGYWKESALNRHEELSRDSFRISRDSIETAYYAFRTGVLVWDEAKKSKENPCFDAWSALYAQGEAYMKFLIRLQMAGARVQEY